MGNLGASFQNFVNEHQLLNEDVDEYFGFSPSEINEQIILNILPDSTRVNTNVNIQRRSIQLSNLDKKIPNCDISFVFDALSPCLIEIYCQSTDKNLRNLVTQRSYPKGLTQVFEYSCENFVCKSEDTEEELSLFVIIIKGEEDNDYDSFKQISTLNVVDEELIVNQKIIFKDKAFVTREIFGLEPESLREDCVICLSELKNVVLIPCNHFCVCRPCAQILKLSTNKCPICRGNVRSMIVDVLHKHQEVVIETDTPNENRDEIEEVRNSFRNLPHDDDAFINVIDLSRYTDDSTESSHVESNSDESHVF